MANSRFEYRLWEDKDRISLFPDLKWSLRECGNSDPYLEEGEGEHQTILPEADLEQQCTEIQSDWFSEWDTSGHLTGVSFIKVKDGSVLKMDHWYAFVIEAGCQHEPCQSCRPWSYSSKTRRVVLCT